MWFAKMGADGNHVSTFCFSIWVHIGQDVINLASVGQADGILSTHFGKLRTLAVSLTHPKNNNNMRFACFGYINETKWDKIPEQDQRKILDDYFSFYQHLKSIDKFLGGTGLKSVKEACKLSLTDNNVREISLPVDKEQLGGFFIVEAKDLEEAKSIVSKHPGLKVGDFEIRTVDEDITEMVGAK